MQQLNPSVLKSVNKDGEKEQRELKIENWKNELSAFQSADISKNFDPALRCQSRRLCNGIYCQKERTADTKTPN
ncbi:hypothetical protein KUH03_28120 [Sphingobacterium sp. E70]|uniref:hypothetical protein n=1 Tax=Sphingobacterium sp. E70 TaxID=2853439 RepID=UPI00211B7B0C|nr:hypothetical protein [Sphingobacterium sp. E70]ULT23080.1 hypothetical protein KUH03_28120 [Sphingobacterium sp. E70]